MRRRRIAMIGSVPAEFGGAGRGGIAVHTGRIATALSAAGEDVTVLASDAGRGALDEMASAAPFRVVPYSAPTKRAAARLVAKLGGGLGAPASTHRASLTWRQSFLLRALGQLYRELFRANRPDIVHVHSAGMTVLAVERALARYPRPLVVTVHSLRGHVSDDMFFGRVVPSLFAADALITVSRHLKEEAVSYGIDESKVHVIPNGVDRSVFAPVGRENARRLLGLDPEAPIVLLVAHLIGRKGADIAIRAMREVLVKAPSAKLYLIGAAQSYTDRAWLEGVRDLPAALDIRKSVVFAGDIPGHTDGALNLWYNAADVLVLPSRAEGMGMVLTEAMAAGTPVIGSRVGGIPDVITDRSNGLLVPPEDPRSLAAAVIELLETPALREDLTQRALRRVSEEHNWDALARKTQGVYDAVLPRLATGRRVEGASTQKTIAVFSDRSFVPADKDYVALLYPLWGRNRDPERALVPDPFERYLQVGASFFRLTSLADADIAVLPVAWNYVVETAERREQARLFARRASAAGKRTVVFFNSDSNEEVWLENSLVFRTSLYRSSRRHNEFALPAWSEDFVSSYLGGQITPREKKDVPVVGFCGYAAPLLKSFLRNSARWAASIAGIRAGAVNPFEAPGHALRLKALRALEKSPRIATNFVVRDAFFRAGFRSNAAQAASVIKLRREFVDNIVNSDYTLCVRGAGNFSYRLYETLCCGRIPVFVDTDCVLPYESIIDWERYSVFVDEADVDRIGERVADFHARLSPDEFVQLQRDNRRLWQDYLSPQGFFGNLHRLL